MKKIYDAAKKELVNSITIDACLIHDAVMLADRTTLKCLPADVVYRSGDFAVTTMTPDPRRKQYRTLTHVPTGRMIPLDLLDTDWSFYREDDRMWVELCDRVSTDADLIHFCKNFRSLTRSQKTLAKRKFEDLIWATIDPCSSGTP